MGTYLYCLRGVSCTGNQGLRARHFLRGNSTLSDALRPVLKFTVGSWAWAYNTAATIPQGAKTDTDTKVLKTKLSLNWTGPYQVLQVGPRLAPVPPLTPRTAPLSALRSIFGSILRHSRRGCSPANFGTTLQALCKPAWPWRHADVFFQRG